MLGPARAGADRRRAAGRVPPAPRGRAAEQPAPAEAGQHAARFLAHRGGTAAGAPRSRSISARSPPTIASVFRSTIESAGLTFTVDCPPLDEPVAVDREMWEKVVLNLLSNAFKFTLDGTIAIALRREGGTAVLTVRDTGTGIAAAELPHLFERFHRVRGAGGRSFEGSGIGLALVRELVRLHHGEVHVESEPGQGSTFRVTIPARSHVQRRGRGDRRAGCRTRRPRGPASQAAAMVAEASRWLPAAAIAAEPAGAAARAAAHRRRRRQRRHARLRGRPARPDQPRRGGRRRHGRARRHPARAGRSAARRRDDAAPGRPGAAADDPRRRGAAFPAGDLRLGARRRRGARHRASRPAPTTIW